MFTKLRNRFLIVNLVTISVIMLVAFISIYVITYRDVQNDIQMDLHRIMENYKSPGGDTGRLGNTKGEPRYHVWIINVRITEHLLQNAQSHLC